MIHAIFYVLHIIHLIAILSSSFVILPISVMITYLKITASLDDTLDGAVYVYTKFLTTMTTKNFRDYYMVSINSSFIINMESPSKRTQMVAFNRNPRYIIYCNDPTDDMWIDAVNRSMATFKEMPKNKYILKSLASIPNYRKLVAFFKLHPITSTTRYLHSHHIQLRELYKITSIDIFIGILRHLIEDMDEGTVVEYTLKF